MVFDALLHLAEAGRESIGESGALCVDGLSDCLGAPVEGAFECGQALVDGVVERLDRGVERHFKRGDAGIESALEDAKAFVEGVADLGAMRSDARVEGVDIGFQAVGNALGVLAHALDDLAAIGLHRAVELRDVTRDQCAERAAVAGEFLGQLATLFTHQRLERGNAGGEGFVRAFGLARDLGDQRVDGDVEGFAHLVAAGEDVVRKTGAGLVHLRGEVDGAQLHLVQQRVAGILEGVVNLLGAQRDAVDDRIGTLFEVAGDALDAVVEQLMDVVGEFGEFVVDVAGFEIEVGGELFARLQHRVGGLVAGFLEAVEQVAAALAERDDHVVAGSSERAGNVVAALFQHVGDVVRHLVHARGDGVADDGDVLTQVDLHARDRVANLLGLADEVVALGGDVLKQGANADFVVAVGAFKRRNFVGDEGFQFAGTRNGALDAVAHRRDFTADRLTDGDHGIARDVLGLGEAHGHLRHGLGDHAQFLAAPGNARDEVEQDEGRDEHAGEADESQRAAVRADHGFERGQERDDQEARGGNPQSRENGGEGIGAAAGADALKRLEDRADGFAVVIGGLTAETDIAEIVFGRAERFVGQGRLVIGRLRWIGDVQRFLNRGEGDFSWVFDLRIFRHLLVRPCLFTHLKRGAATMCRRASPSLPHPAGHDCCGWWLVPHFRQHPIG
ncbi:hypothetical protein BN961_00770 [Afipia felis]|uniref:Uncharacterized protein n=1 Tax=Afipia felis TaxID=1035 RepID=A0A090MIU2_AFIFE|nr:hypothetical protein BN961_00770 [Afipia felis]